MYFKLKSPVFIDHLTFHFNPAKPLNFHACLKDEQGITCKTLEQEVAPLQKELRWTGLGDLPYGVYTMEWNHDSEETGTLRLVKRV